MLTELVGFLAAGLLGANSLFQFALAAGVGWGDMAFGGKVAQDDGSVVYDPLQPHQVGSPRYKGVTHNPL